ncbi:hypothetical protein DICVIV_10124 [Dictyocaulus viviparus]|uniref:HEAT repeat protein n=1 Tax=Dictyocaulus viviparus TaxID=29172 RepID=A0A0D8XJC1_DICVI|nr:hypothetical protein DICVIV_10124 [Dictyocaulus viviparus]
MAATKIEQLEAAVNTLDVCLKSTEFLVSTRCVSYDKERSICAEIRGIVVASDFSVLHKVDRRYGDILAKAVENLFKMVNHIDPDIRMYAEESLDAIFRDLYRVAVNNLELSGPPNRAAVIIIAHISTYYPSIMNKVFLRCMVNVRDADDALSRAPIIGSLNTLKAIWPLLLDPGCGVLKKNIQIVICSVLRCLYSSYSEVVVPCIELLEKITTNPLPWLRDFVPLEFEKSLFCSPRCEPTDRSSRTVSPFSGAYHSLYDASSSFNKNLVCDIPLQLPNRSQGSYSSERSSSILDEEVIDPLMHADLYEEVIKCDRYEDDQLCSQINNCLDDSVGILRSLPHDVCASSANFFVYTAAILGKRFLLAGLKGLKNDRDVRISHKILALNCIAMISKYEDISKATIFFGNFEQSMLEVSRFILHDDDQLCASTVMFLFTVDTYRFGSSGTCLEAIVFPDNVHNYQRVMRSCQPIRKRSILQASIGQQHVLDALGLLSDALQLATTEVSSTFFLLKVLNMPPGFRFRGECPDFVVESNLEVIIDLIMDYFTFDVHKRSAGLCYTVNALLKAFPASVFCECWGCLSRQPSSSYGFLSTFLELCELNLNSIHKLSTGLRVIAALFAGHCESYMMNAVQEQSTFDRLSLPRLPEQVFLDSVLNLYYCLITEYRSVNSQSSTSFISRPTFSPLSNRKLSSSRNADISKLLGTRIHPVLPTSYLESCTIKHLFHSVEGAHKNFLEHLDIDCESRFLLLLQAALDCLGTVCEMLTFSRLKPHLQEILLYVKAIFEVCPDGCTTLLHQLFKVVFGKNAANINLDILQSMKMKDPLPPLNEAEMLYLRYENDFTLFCAFVNRKEYIDAFVSRSLGWLKTDILSRVHNPPPNEIAPALQLFEGFVTLLLQVYNAFQSVPCKRAILGVMCELPRDGIIYAMADPKKVLFEAVTTQLYDPSAGNKELLKEIALYLIVLARTSVIKYDYLAQLAVQLIEKAIQSNAIQVISAVEVILLEILFVQRVDGTVIYSAFREKSENLFNMASQSTFLIWILFLHSSRNDENRWSSTSIDFFAAYSVYIANCSESSLSHSVFTAVIAFSCMAPAMYRPVDTIFCLLQNCMDEDTSFTLKLKRCVPLLFSILNNVAEEKLLMRIEQIIDNPLEWLVQSICGLLVECSNLTNISNQKVYDYVLFLFLTIVNMIKSDHYPKLSAALQVYLKSVNSLPLQQLITTYPVILSQWLQLLSLFKEPVTKHIDVSQCTEYVSRLCVALSSLSDESTSIPNIICKLPPQSELPTNCTLLEFCKSVFTGSLWSFPNAFKSAISKSQQLFDVIYDLVEFDGEAHENALRLKLFVLSRIHTMNINELVWGNFGPKEVLALIEYSAQELKHPYCDLRATCNGLKFLLEHCSTKEIFIGDIFFGIQSIRKKARCKFDHFLSNDKIGIFFPDDDVPTSDFEDFGGLDGKFRARYQENALGWISRQQFEDFWMSLFGVLSSTPTGNELISENVTMRCSMQSIYAQYAFNILFQNLTEQILASSVAVSVLTDILLYSLLYPEPGNPPTGHFIIKHRERNEPFYKSKSIQLLSSLKSKLTHDLDPMLAYKRNIERLDYKGDYYGLGQMSALSLWTLTGVLNDENPQQLAKADSPMALLSDLFDDSASYEFMFSQMRNVFFGDYLKYHSDIGYVIYSLLKSVTVIGLDIAARGMTEGDLSKQILLWVECGLTSRSPFVREATLHGFIYLMQSMTLDALKPVVQYVTAFLLEETCKHLSTNDRTNICSVPSSLEYIHLIWSASFRIMEEPLQLSFKTTLIQRTCEIFTVLNFSGCLLPVVTSGIEALVLHSACYLPQFLQLVEGCFEAYATISSTFVYALRILIACVFKGLSTFLFYWFLTVFVFSVDYKYLIEEVDPRRTSSRKFEVILEELYSIYRRCDSRDAELISVVLPSVLLRLYNEEKVFALISNFCSPLSSGGYPRHINYSLQMMYELCERMRYNQRMSSLNSFAQNVVFQIRGRPPLCREDRAVASCLLAAVSSYEYIAYRFPVYLAALFSTESFESSYEFLLLKAIEECPSSC